MNLKREIIQVNQNNVPPDEIFIIIEDISILLEGSNMREYEINQYMVGIINLFRGYMIKV